MSMPKFPDINPDITCDSALNMILASIAMEELALSHIINAEGEKIQYILKTLEPRGVNPHSYDEILGVNRSVTELMDSIAQNQSILKNKMDSVLNAMSFICPNPHPPYPPCPPPYHPCPPPPKPPVHHRKCCAVFKAAQQCRLWYPDSKLTWGTTHIYGECARIDPCDKTKIELCAKGRYTINFAVNVKAKPDCTHNTVVSLQTTNNHLREDIYTVHNCLSYNGGMSTISLAGVIIEVTEQNLPLSLRLVSPDVLSVEDSMLSIIEI